MKQSYTYEDLHGQLANGIREVHFTKVNGDNRIMTCTMDPSKIPTEYHPKGNTDITEGVDRTIKALRVFDVKLQAWRSFRIESVYDVQEPQE